MYGSEFLNKFLSVNDVNFIITGKWILKLAVISHPSCILHAIKNHPECPDRVSVINKALVDSDFWEKIVYLTAPLALKEKILLAHSKGHVNYIFSNSPCKDVFVIDPDTIMMQHSLDAAQRAAGAVIFAVDLITSGEYKRAFCNIRPPGHHAEKNQAMGFCFFNNVAIGVNYALQHESIQKVAIIDFDVHHGNGTADIFAGNNSVLFLSSYQRGIYAAPYAKENCQNIKLLPLSSNSNAELLINMLQGDWSKYLESFQPDLIFVSAGFDAYKEDQLAGLSFEVDDFAKISSEIVKLSNKFCAGKVISCLEGGYNLKGLADCAVAHVRCLLKD